MPKRAAKALCDRPVAARARRANIAPYPRSNSASVSGASASGSTRGVFVTFRFAAIGFPHADDAVNFIPHGEHANPYPFPHHAVCNESFLDMREPHVQDVQPVGVGEHLGPERQGYSVLFPVARVLAGIERDPHCRTIRYCRTPRNRYK